MFGLIIFIHVIVCILLIVIILIQRGHGGGLVESFSGVESIFGTKTNTFLSRFTTVLATLFLFTCLSLAVFSARQSKSLMGRVKSAPAQAQAPESAPQVPPQPQTQIPVEVKPQPEVQPPPEGNKTE